MVAPALARFVVGIGYDMDAGSERAAQASFDRLKKGLGALSAVASGIAVSNTMLANSTVQISHMSKMNSIAESTAEAMRRVFTMGGAEGSEFDSVIAKLNQWRDSAGELGDAGWAKELAMIGLNPQRIKNAESVWDSFLELANQMAGLTKAERRLARDAVGVGDSGALLMSEGAGAILQSLRERLKEFKLKPDEAARSEEWLENVQKFETAMMRFGVAIKGLTEGPLGRLIEMLTNFVNWGSDKIDGEPNKYDETIDREVKGFKYKYRNNIGTGNSVPRNQGVKTSSVIQLNLNGQVLGSFVSDFVEQNNKAQVLEIIPNVG